MIETVIQPNPVQVTTVKPILVRAFHPHENASLRQLCHIYKLPEMCWRKSGNAEAIRRLPLMQAEGRKYIIAMIRRGWNEKPQANQG